ncbi:hypothetical protein RRG08_027536 [Elysia crispata]|uniref:Uncharacterized protein n=1 Tax=Elysia crispata TaxID=231223 RepID=A0AAE0YRK9_9GAST|nr:hypothetical protein RRG08_027536 [Elysia crispata]
MDTSGQLPEDYGKKLKCSMNGRFRFYASREAKLPPRRPLLVAKDLGEGQLRSARQLGPTERASVFIKPIEGWNGESS